MKLGRNILIVGGLLILPMVGWANSTFDIPGVAQSIEQIAATVNTTVSDLQAVEDARQKLQNIGMPGVQKSEKVEEQASILVNEEILPIVPKELKSLLEEKDPDVVKVEEKLRELIYFDPKTMIATTETVEGQSNKNQDKPGELAYQQKYYVLNLLHAKAVATISQQNSEKTTEDFKKLKEDLEKRESIIDLYKGLGILTIQMAGKMTELNVLASERARIDALRALQGARVDEDNTSASTGQKGLF